MLPLPPREAHKSCYLRYCSSRLAPIVVPKAIVEVSKVFAILQIPQITNLKKRLLRSSRSAQACSKNESTAFPTRKMGSGLTRSFLSFRNDFIVHTHQARVVVQFFYIIYNVSVQNHFWLHLNIETGFSARQIFCKKHQQ